ncbi:hypothetical protein BGZ90_008241, partial [Linnemannia elongata]
MVAGGGTFTQEQRPTGIAGGWPSAAARMDVQGSGAGGFLDRFTETEERLEYLKTAGEKRLR